MPIINFSQKANSFLKNNLQHKNRTNKVSLGEKKTIYFSKHEFTFILNLYSKQVAQGTWRDYALDSKNDIAVFSVYRHTYDQPMYQFIKTSKKGYRNNPDFYIKDSSEVIYKSKVFEQMLFKFEKKINIKKQNLFL